MQRELIWNGTPIRYDLQRKQVKNLNLRVRADGSVSVSAHPRVPESVIDRFVQARAEWILHALARYGEAENSRRTPLTYTDGESLRLLGQTVTLRVLAGRKNEVECREESIVLTVRDTQDVEMKQRVLDAWRAQICRETVSAICERVYPLFARYGVLPPVIRFRKMKSRWGSCQPQKGILTFNTSLCEVPISCIEYVVFHEFTHFLHPDHSPRFYERLSTFLPDWKERKRRLEQRTEE